MTLEELKELQSLPLPFKVEITKQRIADFYDRLDGKVYVAFSGGKDSSALLHLVRSIYPDTPAVYGNTGIDLPSVRKLVSATDNVKVLPPLKTFGRVLKEDGLVFPSKMVAKIIKDARGGANYALQYLNGCHKDGTPSDYKKANYAHWKWLLDVDVPISHLCCYYLKEGPMLKFEKESGLRPYVGIRATESTRRRDAWLKTGCNSFEQGKEKSKPLSFWTEQDILEYLVQERIPIASAYGSIVRGIDGKLRTTGEARTGCMFCPIPLAHKDNRLPAVKQVAPKMYDTFMNKMGLGEMFKKLGMDYEYAPVKMTGFAIKGNKNV